jgi:hypothetical protein
VTLCERRRLRADEVIHEGHDFAATQNVCFWHKADMATGSTNVRFRVNSGHRDFGRPVCF